MTATGTGGGSKHTDIYYKLLECFRIRTAGVLSGFHWRKHQFISLCICCSSAPFRPHQTQYLPTKHFPECFLWCFCVSLFVECPSLAPAASVQVASSNKQRPRPRLSPPYLSVSPPSHSPTAWLGPDTPTRINKTQPTSPTTFQSLPSHFSPLTILLCVETWGGERYSSRVLYWAALVLAGQLQSPVLRQSACDRAAAHI